MYSFCFLENICEDIQGFFSDTKIEALKLGLLPKIPKTPSPTPKTKQVGQKRKKSGTTAKPAPRKKKKTLQ
jgi:hypothetical protein